MNYARFYKSVTLGLGYRSLTLEKLQLFDKWKGKESRKSEVLGRFISCPYL